MFLAHSWSLWVSKCGKGADDASLEDNKLLIWLKNHIPLAKNYDGEKFFTI